MDTGSAQHLITRERSKDHDGGRVAAPARDAADGGGSTAMMVHDRVDTALLHTGSAVALLCVVALAAVPHVSASARSGATAAATSTSAASEAPPVEALPGGLVRWSGNGIEACRLGQRSWGEYRGACWYPVDLLQHSGQLEVERTRHGEQERTTVRIGSYPYPTQHLTVASEMANPPADQLDRIRRESERVQALWDRTGPAAFELPLRSPLDQQTDPRSFGSRRVFNGESRDPHSGIDLSAPVGTAVHAAARGLVVIAAEHYFSGRSVFIDHGGELITMYFHLDRIDVGEGDVIERGQVIGTVGATGRITGPHLHFGVRWHGARVDPVLLLGSPDDIVDIATTNRH
jgi:hypothetical protein